MTQEYKHSIPEIYDFLNKPKFGVEGYKPVSHYQNPVKEIEREYGVPVQKKIKATKRGHYLDQIQSYLKKFPKPKYYEVQYQWPDPKAKPNKINSGSKKESFIDAIFNQPKEKRTPGPGAYDSLTLDQIKLNKTYSKKQFIQSDKFSSFQENSVQSSKVPGPGNYNPHKNVKKDKDPQLWNNPKSMIQMHAQSLKKIDHDQSPIPGQYDPIDPTQQTFSLIASQKYNKNKNVWSKDKRFQLDKKIKFPGPGKYFTQSNWKNNVLHKTTSYQDLISKGVHKSIYYDKHKVI